MPTPFPHRYEVGLDWDGRGAARLSAGPRPAIAGGAPPEFDGEAGWWSPEHLLLSSLSLCLMTTFQVFARKAALPVRAYRGHAEGVLDKTRNGLTFTAITLHVEVKVTDGATEKAQQLLSTAKEHCIVARSLTPPIHLDASVLAG